MTEPRPDNLNELVSLQEGARRLGLTNEALRMRLRRGQSAGEHHGRTWLVWLPREDQTGPDRTTTESDRSEADNRPDTDRNATVLLDQLRTENVYLRAALERSQAGEAELRRLLGNSQQQLGIAQARTLPAGLAADMPADATEGPTVTATPPTGAEWPNVVSTAPKDAGVGKRQGLVERLSRLFRR